MLQSNQLILHRRLGGLAPPLPWTSDGKAPAIADVIAELSVTSNIDAMEHEWRDFEQRADCTPFQTFDWLATWQRCVGTPARVKPAIIAGRRRNRLLFMLPLAIERMRLSSRLVFLGSSLCDYNAPLLAPEFHDLVAPADFVEWWQSVQTFLQDSVEFEHDSVLFDKMPEKVGGQSNPLAALTTELTATRAYLANLSADWDTFYASKRSANTRRRDRTKRKGLCESGELRLVTAKDPEETRSTLNILWSQKGRWFDRMGIPNLFDRPGYAEFYASIAATANQFVHVSRLDVGSQCVAANLGLTFRGCYYHVLASYDDGPLSRFGPGIVHLHELMRYAIGQGCRQYDFTIGDEGYKRDWADTTIELYDHIAAANRFGRMTAALTIFKLRAKRFVRQSSLLWPIVSRLRALLGHVRSSKTPKDFAGTEF